jgi:hypothetical protein
VALFLEVYNLFDTQNLRGYSTNLNIDGRTGRVFFVRHGQQWIPRLPTFGIAWEFGSASK